MISPKIYPDCKNAMFTIGIKRDIFSSPLQNYNLMTIVPLMDLKKEATARQDELRKFFFKISSVNYMTTAPFS